jgi:hypothetical protein
MSAAVINDCWLTDNLFDAHDKVDQSALCESKPRSGAESRTERPAKSSKQKNSGFPSPLPSLKESESDYTEKSFSLCGGVMKILVGEITESPKTLCFDERVDELNKIGTGSEYQEFRFPSSVAVRITFYRSGQEILLAGCLQGVFEGCCSRCLEVFGFPAEKIQLFYPGQSDGPEEELRNGDGIELLRAESIPQLIREQILHPPDPTSVQGGMSRPLRRLQGQRTRKPVVVFSPPTNDWPCSAL